MEKTVDLKTLDVQNLCKQEMKCIDGGSLLSSLYNAFPIGTTMVLTGLAIDREIIEGMEQGWLENKR